MKKFTLSLASVIALSSIGFAGGDIEPVPVPLVVEVTENPFYVGIAYATTSTRKSSVDLDFFSEKHGQDNMGNITLNAGYVFNPYIAVEGRYTTSFSKEHITDMNGWSLFVKPQYPISSDFSIYALLGFGGVTLDGFDPLNPVDVDDTGFQWGLGVSYSLRSVTQSDVAIFIDYTSLAKDMDGLYMDDLQASVDALTIGVTYSF